MAKKKNETVKETEENAAKEPEETTAKEPEETTAKEPEETAAKEPEETAAKEPEETVFPNPCVYCGPTVRGVARQYTTYQGGPSEELKAFLQEHPAARELIVSPSRFPSFRRRLETRGTKEERAYRKVISEIR